MNNRMSKGLTLLAIMLVLGTAFTSCTREKQVFVVVTPTEVPGTATPLPTPTLTAEQVAYTLAVASQQAQATRDAHATQTAMPTSTPVPPPYKLALLSGNCTKDASIGFTTCEGFVKNISGSILKEVQVVVTWVVNGVPTASDDALIEYTTLLPDQESPWKVIADYNPAFSTFRVNFREFGGLPILTRIDDPSFHSGN